MYQQFPDKGVLYLETAKIFKLLFEVTDAMYELLLV